MGGAGGADAHSPAEGKRVDIIKMEEPSVVEGDLSQSFPKILVPKIKMEIKDAEEFFLL